jgi:MtfA peptidase
MLWTWIKNRRRRKLRSRPLAPQWQAWIEALPFVSRLTPAEQEKLCGDVQVFLAEKNWEGCGGFAMTDEAKVTIAAQACLLVLALEVSLFDGVQSILVYPAGYLAPDREHLGDGVTLEGEIERLGEAWYRGPVVLAWDEVCQSVADPDDGYNLVLHEFAHQLDMRSGAMDGTPPLADRRQARRWHEVMTAEFQRLCRAAESNRATLLDHYGATDESEFFAVATECFFEQGAELRRRHQRLYELLRDFYRQDPADRDAREPS